MQRIPKWVRNLLLRYLEDPETFASLSNTRKKETRRVLRNYHLIPGAAQRARYSGVLPVAFKANPGEYRRLYMQRWRKQRSASLPSS